MFVRLTYMNFSPGKIAEVKDIYTNEVARSIRRQNGNIQAMLLQPADDADDYISCTMWTNKDAADAYQSSDTYTRDFSKIKELTTKQPRVKYYSVDAVEEVG